MQIKVNDEVLFELSDVQKKVICADIHEDEFDDDMKRRLEYVIKHKYDQCYDRLEKEWLPKLRNRLASVPTSKDAFAALVFEQEDYKSRKDKDLEIIVDI